MAAKILSVVFTAATAALVKTAFDAWAAGGAVICGATMSEKGDGSAFDLIVFYYA